ncbi:hypothetical protein BD289DRAFT_446249 [Coniella lustricola]|uniref:Zn(2)-C6 fungal-type domain-containing protein n=1 Tax=Coniella lustricola TaxID=2025994 RepID=A0A2T2ZU25_9PEZI|nr:hypothetical protein BD289DRAFT_446249 [Coniella lustricola]
MGGGTRRFHHKSRNGCGQCKAKHIRCDLQAPICRNCDKKGLRCDYLDLGTEGQIASQGASSSNPAAPLASALVGSAPAHRSRTHAHQNARGQYSVLTFRIDRAAGAPSKDRHDKHHPADQEPTLLSPRLCPRLEPAARDKLIAHWFAFTADSVPLRDSSTSSHIWRRGIALTPIIRGGPYVVEALRCVALLHINYLRTSSESKAPTAILGTQPSRSMTGARRKPGVVFHDLENPDILQACTHLGNAITEFRSEVTSINHRNWLACIAFALAIIIYNFDHARRAPPDDFQTIVIDTIKAMRSAFTMRSSVVPLTRNSDFPLMSTGDESHPPRQQEDLANAAVLKREAQIKEDTLERIDSLLQNLMSATGHNMDPPDIQYNDYQKFMLGMTRDQLPASLEVMDSRLLAALALRTWAHNIDAWPRSWLDVMFWPWCLPAEFLDLLAAKDAVSLVILTYWFALIDRVTTRWFLEGWAKRGIAVAVLNLGPEWDDLVAWPKAQVGLA